MFLLASLRASATSIRQKLAFINIPTFRLIFRTPIRHQSGDVTRFGTKTFKEARFLQKDKIPDGYHIIYRAPMANYIYGAHYMTTLSAVIVTGIAVYIAIVGEGSTQDQLQIGKEMLQAEKEDVKFFAVGFILLCWSVRYLVMRYPQRIYRNDKKYIAIFEGHIPLTNRRLAFTKGEVTQARPYGVLPWRHSWYHVRNKRALMLVEYFKSPAELYNMLNADQNTDT